MHDMVVQLLAHVGHDLLPHGLEQIDFQIGKQGFGEQDAQKKSGNEFEPGQAAGYDVVINGQLDDPGLGQAAGSHQRQDQQHCQCCALVRGYVTRKAHQDSVVVSFSGDFFSVDAARMHDCLYFSGCQGGEYMYSCFSITVFYHGFHT